MMTESELAKQAALDARPFTYTSPKWKRIEVFLRQEFPEIPKHIKELELRVSMTEPVTLTIVCFPAGDPK